MTRKAKGAVLFGGRSAERAVSVSSGRTVYRALRAAGHETEALYIDEHGGWHVVDGRLFERGGVGTVNGAVPVGRVAEMLGRVDVAFPVLHGPYGEDGTMQGFLATIGVPFVGSGVLGSAVGIDKDVTKRLLRDAGIAVSDFRVVEAGQVDEHSAHRLVCSLGLPLVVKPTRLGSSMGVTRVTRKSRIFPALQSALRHGRRALVERWVDGREVECGVLGNGHPVASLPGEIVRDRERDPLYSYKEKYSRRSTVQLGVPADLPPVLIRRVRELALQVFSVLGCECMARVDMFVPSDGTVIVNEVNTIPGLTRTSMYPRLWQAEGIGIEELVDTLVSLAQSS
jgi:D-alanine-D-alanine ligase